MPHELATCAFCGQSMEQVGPLVEAQRADCYICYACAMLVMHIIEAEYQRRGLPHPVKENNPFLAMAGWLKDDPLYEALQEEIRENRRRRDIDDETDQTQ